jgi:hypothetical protein
MRRRWRGGGSAIPVCIGSQAMHASVKPFPEIRFKSVPRPGSLQQLTTSRNSAKPHLLRRSAVSMLRSTPHASTGSAARLARNEACPRSEYLAAVGDQVQRAQSIQGASAPRRALCQYDSLGSVRAFCISSCLTVERLEQWFWCCYPVVRGPQLKGVWPWKVTYWNETLELVSNQECGSVRAPAWTH